jgi:hypothetical protein
MSRYPLGRIHPHGSGGKSVWQRVAPSVRQPAGLCWKIFVWGAGLWLGINLMIECDFSSASFVFFGLICFFVHGLCK